MFWKDGKDAVEKFARSERNEVLRACDEKQDSEHENKKIHCLIHIFHSRDFMSLCNVVFFKTISIFI